MKRQKLGLSVAHTPGDPETEAAGERDERGEIGQGSGEIGGDRDQVAGEGLRPDLDAAARDLERQLGAQVDDEPDLFDEPPPLFAGPVMHVANTVESAGGRGRPKGAQNRRTTKMREYLLRKGYLHPMEALAQMASASPHVLALELGCKKIEALDIIRKANVDLLPYMESKAPQQLDVNAKTLGLFLVGDLGDGQVRATDFLSVTGAPAEDEENQELSGDATVRPGDPPSHGGS